MTDKSDLASIFSKPAAISYLENADSNVFLICEHASNHIPEALNNLGLSDSDALSHRGWDIGAEKVAKGLSDHLNAPLIYAGYSRLVYDCNRSPEASSSIVKVSDNLEIPGNLSISDDERQARIQYIYEAFHDEVYKKLSLHMKTHDNPILITIHSFTPVYDGEIREVEIGILHEKDSRLADEILIQVDSLSSSTDCFNVRRNEPYGPKHNVMHTLNKHGVANSIPHVMIEISNTLIDKDESINKMVHWLAPIISASANAITSEHHRLSKVVN